MAKQVVNIGTAPNDGTGDSLRVAFDKVNDNFTELYESGGGGGDDADKLNTDQSTQQETLGALKFDAYDLDTAGVMADAVGRIKWNATDGCPEVGLEGGTVVLQIGQEELIRVENQSHATIPNGSVVYIVNAGGSRPHIALADASSHTSAYVLGVTTEEITHGSEGFVTMSGLVREVNTNGYVDGTQLWLSETPGAFTNIKPTAPAISVFIGYVIYGHTQHGIIAVRPTLVPRMQMLSDVYGYPSSEGHFYTWNVADNRFELSQKDVYDLVDITTRSYMPTMDDIGALITISNANTCALIIPSNSLVAFPNGSRFFVEQGGTGELIITGNEGVTINALSGLHSEGQYAVMEIIKKDTDTWLCLGGIAGEGVVDNAPTDIALSVSTIDENNSIGDTVGQFTTTDIDEGDEFIYTLVSGAGSTDNASFTINGDLLKAAEEFDYETKSSYSIRVRSTDWFGLYTEKQFAITINDVAEAPTDITLSASSIDENNAIGDTIGNFSSTDEDSGDTFTYTLVSGTGDTDNASFTILNNHLKAAEVFDYDTKSSYSIRVRSTDSNTLYFEKVFTISVNDLGDYDADAQAYFTAAGITDTTEKDAYNTFVVGLKADGIYSKFTAIYPFLGTTASTQKYNAIDPRDADDAYRLTFDGTLTHNAMGITGSGDGYGDTHFNPSIHGTIDNQSISVYSRTSGSLDGVEMGAYDGNIIQIATKTSPSTFSEWAVYNTILTGAGITGDGHYCYSRPSLTGVRSQHNGFNLELSSNATSLVNKSIYILARNEAVVTKYSSRNLAFAHIGEAFSALEVNDFYTRLRTMLTALGRNV